VASRPCSVCVCVAVVVVSEPSFVVGTCRVVSYEPKNNENIYLVS
jgi:hypothetical protein